MAREQVLTPKRWTPRGEAEAMLKGKPVVIWGGIPEEAALVRLLHEGRNRDYAAVREAVRPDPHRVSPRCDRYDLCGGCPLMHLDPLGQHKARRRMVQDALREEGLTDVPVGMVTPSPDGDDDFRWVAKLGVGESDQGRVRLGAWGRLNRAIVPIPTCHVVAPPVRKAMTAVAHHVIDLDIRPYDPRSDRGVLRSIVLRGSRATGEVMVTLVAGRRVRALNDLAERLLTDAAEIVGISLHLNDDEGNAIFERDEDGVIRTSRLEGVDHVTDVIDGISYKIGPGDFFQTNPGMAEVLYRETLDRLQLAHEEAFVDLYSGVGGLALPAARRAGWALGVEEVASAVERARENAKDNGVTAEFVAGRVVEVLPSVAKRLKGVHPVVAVNPARRGLEDGVVDAIMALEPSRMAYISCNPRALARDLVALRDQGMTLDSIALYDMFPNTAHVECVALLTGPASAASARRGPRRTVVQRTRGGED